MDKIIKKLANHETKLQKHADECIVNKSRLKKKHTCYNLQISKIENTVKTIKNEIKEKTERPCVRVKKNDVKLQKSIFFQDDAGKTVLTDSTWKFVIFFLKLKHQDESLFYWEQAYNFYKASVKLTNISKPLTTYYCFLNAVKSLLVFKNIGFNTQHGVSGKRNKVGQIKLQNEEVSFKPSGILSGLCNYLKKPVTIGESYSLKDMLYNLAFIHRSFQLTFSSAPMYPELFIPIIDPRFVFDKTLNKGWFQCKLEEEHSTKSVQNKLKGFGIDYKYSTNKSLVLRRNKKFNWVVYRNKPNQISHNSIERYYTNLRKRVRYIYSPNELWYLKRADLNSKKSIIDRHDLVLIFASMHRLSELSRYNPNILKKHLDSNHSWLLNEFINKSILQFIDNIASEITGKDFRVTGFRT